LARRPIRERSSRNFSFPMRRFRTQPKVKCIRTPPPTRTLLKEHV
jgi:hypothetical protein